MILLAIDTSGKDGSIALARTDEDARGAGVASPSVEIWDVIPLEGGTFSAQLVPQIADLLKKHGLTKEEIDGFAVTSGPGSFTDLGVGLAAVKGLEKFGQTHRGRFEAGGCGAFRKKSRQCDRGVRRGGERRLCGRVRGE
jgi:hypothetical protein